MLRKILIVFLLIILLVAGSTPASATKPPENEKGGNSANQDHGKGNDIEHTNHGRNPANPNTQNPGLLNSKKDVSTSTNNGLNGFDEFGYNRTARIFNGTGESWCMGKFGWDEARCEAYLGVYAHDKLVMKWNAEWDHGNADGWDTPPYDAWENNQWNGKVPGGSGEVWHYKIVWVGPCTDPVIYADGYCIWGQFKVISDHGTRETAENVEHIWLTHAKPNGYGSYKQPDVSEK